MIGKQVKGKKVKEREYKREDWYLIHLAVSHE